MAQAKIFLIDGHALCYRSFYAIKALATSKGQPTNAVFGFVRYILKIFEEHRPEYMAVCFDFPGKTRRQEKFAAYKIQRPPMPEELRGQIPVIKDIMSAMNVAAFEMEGFEADDLIATISQKFSREGVGIVIVSDDKDLYQLAGTQVRFLGSKNGTVLDDKELQEKLGFKPEHIVDYIGLAGDSSDNIPGVTGIGKVNAQQLIKEFGTLEGIIEHLEKAESLKAKEKLIMEQRQTALLSKELAVLDKNVPIQCPLEKLKVRGPDKERLFTIFKDLEFRALSDEFKPGKGAASPDLAEIKEPAEVKDLVKRIEKNKQFTFSIALGGDGGIFLSRAVYATLKDDHGFVLDVQHIALLKPVFEDSGILKVTYNIKEQYKALSAYKIDVHGDVFDVMLAGYLLGAYAAAGSISNLVWHYLKRSIDEEAPEAAQVQSVRQLYPVLLKELESKSMLSLYRDIELPLARVLAVIEQNGIKLDLPLLKKLSAECAGKIDELTAALYEMAGEEFNLNSPKQLSHILFDKLQLPVMKRTKTGNSTDESVLIALAELHVFPSLILQYRQLAKLKSTYIDALPKMADPKTHRIHAQFNQTGTETGRLSSSQPNLQNIPIRTELGRQIRKAFIPADKHSVILAADYSQIELRVLAHLSGDENLIKAFQRGEDIHTYTASLIFEVDEREVTPEMRNSAKRVNFGIIYGISAFGLANDLKVSQAEAQEFIDRYFSRYPAVKAFMDREIKECEKNGYIVTLFNRRRYLPEIHSKNGAMKQFAQRQAINTPVQGSAADMLKIAMVRIQSDIERRGLKTKMISTVHDELVFEMPPAEKQEMVGLIRRHMEHAVELKVPVKVSVKVGQNWLDMEEV
ncbi:MAG: DNA polymerase I [Omnitrophica WOR_2 bacterium RIFCSPHIGHO2_02_FULL_52_10]|nr:MAG: DNA polymerase I [Omnitrophica WOR_2 bacterium RIFCSPHIGHO2_02_FULL_52_10]